MVPKADTESQTLNTQEDKELKLGRSRSESQGNLEVIPGIPDPTSKDGHLECSDDHLSGQH